MSTRTSLIVVFLLFFSISVAAENNNENYPKEQWQGGHNPINDMQKHFEDNIREEPNKPLSDPVNIRVNSSDELARALYESTQNQDAQKIKNLIGKYVKLANSDINLLLYAKGKLALLERRYAKAEEYFAKILQLQPTFLLVKLELARCQFLRNKNIAALTSFNEIKKQVARAEQGYSLNKSLNAYISALKKRDAWRGQVSIGMQYNNNINQSSGDKQEIDLGGGFKFVRKVPKIESGFGLTYNLNLNKHTPIFDQHGFVFSAYLNGTQYSKKLQRFDQNKIGLNFGYRFHRGIDQVDFSFGAENFYLGEEQLDIPLYKGNILAQGDVFYKQYRSKLEYRYFLTKSLISTSFQYSRKNHFNHSSQANDADIYQIDLNLYHQLDNWLLFSGLSYEQQSKKSKFFSYAQTGINLGVQKDLFDLLKLTFYTNVSYQKYKYYNFLIGKKREDVISNIGINLVPIKFFDFAIKPSLQLSHRYQTSNVAWLYSYRQSSAAINLDYRF